MRSFIIWLQSAFLVNSLLFFLNLLPPQLHQELWLSTLNLVPLAWVLFHVPFFYLFFPRPKCPLTPSSNWKIPILLLSIKSSDNSLGESFLSLLGSSVFFWATKHILHLALLSQPSTGKVTIFMHLCFTCYTGSSLISRVGSNSFFCITNTHQCLARNRCTRDDCWRGEVVASLFTPTYMPWAAALPLLVCLNLNLFLWSPLRLPHDIVLIHLTPVASDFWRWR